MSEQPSGEPPLPLVFAGAPVLRLATELLDPAELGLPPLLELVEDMKATMRAAPGVGLAAPQVGLSLRLAVIEDRAEYQRHVPPARLALTERGPVEFHALVNPTLEPVVEAGTVELWEGCLSVPGYMGLVRRHRAVRVRALDERGNARVIDASGWYARILQHEIDHLDGMLYLDRLTPRTLCWAQLWQAMWAEFPVEEAKRALGAP